MDITITIPDIDPGSFNNMCEVGCYTGFEHDDDDGIIHCEFETERARGIALARPYRCNGIPGIMAIFKHITGRREACRTEENTDMAMLTTRQAAETMNVSIATVGKLIRNKAIKGVKVGHNWRIPEEELTAYLNRPHDDAEPDAVTSGIEAVPAGDAAETAGAGAGIRAEEAES